MKEKPECHMLQILQLCDMCTVHAVSSNRKNFTTTN
uniref:Uncharacterized protein n=1 Tax=Nelumbo nucifera TaxID=4432 RepID=A0A822YNZ9_NELNU|nr:TPA_asm: hypothetical protein HUJ06_011910 [Nelumbo nucifera]